MRERDNLKIKAKFSNEINDWNNWKKQKNEVNKLIRKEKSKQIDSEINIVNNDRAAKSLWNIVKRKAYWITSLAPTMLR